MIGEENEKKNEEKNEKLLVDLCECYASLSLYFPSELLSICIPYLLKVASKKEENEETQKEVEIALLALSDIKQFVKTDKELYFNEIKEIILYHQEHHNLTWLAYQSAWRFLTDRLNNERSMEGMIVNEQHFAREAASELDELMRRVDWTRKKVGKGEREVNEVLVIDRWLFDIDYFLEDCTLWNEELDELIDSIVQMYRASKDNHIEIRKECVNIFKKTLENRNVKDEELMKEGAIDAIMEEIQRTTMNEEVTQECVKFFANVLERLKKEKKKHEMK
ncbi:uncharacterized protein MONOS_1714 [Monocercomonoides exilis]|uniref:uncharacterized protein n=1 Tax=Monocercomonoides exilis TaxID=2049356 RepID=UPI003559B905|nr:hypothetical protein MONOS_1714 [Monocercomonoides exilis]|eukprot:MONOS_1714.1-p1 / transcript=MONOS_1714.1 / gene=MONOS_1714 / organism=Monocercomonoides_exilis_PA203 / gene_product=unspecified product / transcript_product=unspecified product / location=Mono_scaffold00031:194577-195471(-) / protein_length=278 / sequence_SO=supercontig / SO=protein_coding / is_pseudo=false